MALFEYLEDFQDFTTFVLKLITNSKTRIDAYSEHNTPITFTIADEMFKNAIDRFKNRGGKIPRYITEVTRENLDSCKRLMQIFDLRHLDGIKGNVIINEKEYISIFTTLNSKEEKNSPHVILSLNKEIIEQQQYVFDTYWKKAIPIKEKINEIEGKNKEDITLYNNIIKVIRDQSNIESLLLTNIHNARTEIILVVNSLHYLTDLFKIGLENSLKYANTQGANIIILYPEEESNKIYEKDNQKIISTIKSYAQIKSISRLNANLLIVDNSKMITITDKKEGFDKNFFGFYTDSNFIVNNFGSLLDTLLNERELLDSYIVIKNELEKSNEKLLESNEKLMANYKNQKEFLNIAAHEFRTPIQAIIGYAEMMEDDQINSNYYINYILRNSHRLDRLAADLLDTARIESNDLLLDKQKTDIKELITRVIQDVSSELETKRTKHKEKEKDNLDYNKQHKAIDIFFFIDEDSDANRFSPIYVMVDRSKITRAILNIINNSVKAIGNDDNGKITITISNKYTNVQKNEILVSIRDTGKGINPKIYPKLFEKFSTDSSSGTGLGLYISKSIIEAHGGRIWANNNHGGNGTSFNIILPLMQ